MDSNTIDRDMAVNRALDLAAKGFHVFPLRVGTKNRPALHGARACPRTGVCRDGHRGWEQRATTDPDRIRACWSVAPFNIGIACGPSGLLVVDLDIPKSPDDVPPERWSRRGARTGRDVFGLVCADAGHPVPDTLSVSTPSGGEHLYFRALAGAQLRNTGGELGNGLGWKVDTRAWGGYVVGPWSTTEHGTYESSGDGPPVDLPTWLHRRLAPKPRTTRTAPIVSAPERLPGYVAAAVRGERQRVAQAAPGAHSSTLFIAAFALGQLVGAGLLPSATAESELHAAAMGIIGTPGCLCTDREIIRTITNGLREGAGKPRRVPAATSGRRAA
ncbi:hypothetical protein FHS29_005021 [Saccharothrix tamanrassetensis]|uniref:DNA primase/polymerase bifunctional N-terminal domain-containing protein n=1 Tax=Saccharothrix tamanrassetensis TaxID=1051531 RepID=A0A841CNB4_9PSEU|nr:bifunctional DNA primase/polymerase [Saccharothrix tamanrassetensis]MBB5958413.1 hypothetical protein [Saccharothrix tamanrassetensis]